MCCLLFVVLLFFLLGLREVPSLSVLVHVTVICILLVHMDMVNSGVDLGFCTSSIPVIFVCSPAWRGPHIPCRSSLLG